MPLKSKVFALLKKPMVRGTLWMLIAKGTRIFVQAAYFVIIARALGAEQYGAFAGVLALVNILTPFSSWGAAHILVKHVARDRRTFSTYWGNAMVLTFVSGLALLVLSLIIGKLVLPNSISPWLVVLVGLSDLIFLRIIDNASKAFLAVDLFSRTAQINVLLSLKNLLAAIALVVFFKEAGVITWAALYLISTLVSAVHSYVEVNRLVGRPQPDLSKVKPEMVEGFHFSVALSAQTVYNDIDKAMLASLGTLEATGIYAAAYRLIGVAFAPVASLMAAGYARFFKHGQAGISGTLKLGKKFLPVAGGYGLLGSIGLFVLAPVVPYLLGDEYRDAVEAIRWLSPILFIKSVRFFAADALTGAGFQGIRSGVQVALAIFNSLLNLWLIPLYSWRGAAFVSVLTDGLLAIALWGLVFSLHQKQQRAHANSETGG